MNTIVTATKPIVLLPATVMVVMRHATGWIYTTYETYGNFTGVGINRPVSDLIRHIVEGRVDKVIQVGYKGRKTRLVKVAEARGLDVVLIRDTE